MTSTIIRREACWFSECRKGDRQDIGFGLANRVASPYSLLRSLRIAAPSRAKSISVNFGKQIGTGRRSGTSVRNGFQQIIGGGDRNRSVVPSAGLVIAAPVTGQGEFDSRLN